MKQDFWTYNKPLSMTGFGGGAGSLKNAGGESFAGYNEPKLSNGTGLTFGPYDASGNALTGFRGPTKTNLRNYYQGQGWGSWVNDDVNFTTTSTGIQVWVAPETRSYTFEMESRKHFASPNGKGRHLKFEYNLSAGDRLFILPGQGCNQNPDGNTSFGGNGGTFLVMGNRSETDVDVDLLARNSSDAIAVCGGAGRYQDAPAPGNHPSGSDAETAQNNGSGRNINQYHGVGDGGGGPSGGAGFLRSACQHDGSGNAIHVYNEKADSTSFIYDADCFVRGGLGGRGYKHSSWSSPSSLSQGPIGDPGMAGSGGFGGGGGQSVNNSHNSGSGGFQGGNENNGSYMYPDTYRYANGVQRIQAGGSYIKSGISLITNQAGNGTVSYVKIQFT